MRIKETKVYQFHELDDSAKEKARDWFRSVQGEDTFWSECVADDFVEIAGMLGWDIDKPRGRRTGHAVYWDLNPVSVSFEGSWSVGRLRLAELIAHAPIDKELHTIANRYAAIGAQFPDSYGRCDCAYSKSAQIDFSAGTSDDGIERTDTEWRELRIREGAAEEEFTEVTQDLAYWLAKRVDAGWTYINSDEVVDESILANEYEFTEDGERA